MFTGHIRYICFTATVIHHSIVHAWKERGVGSNLTWSFRFDPHLF